ncbi:unnamed protein product [Periconia digitata]|uniref:Nitrogen regulatory protein areA GATA-like domain-containing protein n=1 Tax=Periconia digitata TaxID=1303443 RepID=A0A9W4UA55_9PLEO|nr:unnamed protein product [Periconia digitata]
MSLRPRPIAMYHIVLLAGSYTTSQLSPSRAHHLHSTPGCISTATAAAYSLHPIPSNPIHPVPSVFSFTQSLLLPFPFSPSPLLHARTKSPPPLSPLLLFPTAPTLLQPYRPTNPCLPAAHTGHPPPLPFPSLLLHRARQERTPALPPPPPPPPPPPLHTPTPASHPTRRSPSAPPRPPHYKAALTAQPHVGIPQSPNLAEDSSWYTATKTAAAATTMMQVLPQMPDVSVSRPTLRSSSSTTSASASFFDSQSPYPPPRRNSYSFSDLSSHASLSSSQHSSAKSSTTSSLSLDTRFDDCSSDDDELSFPTYVRCVKYADNQDAPPSSPVRTTPAEPATQTATPASTPDQIHISEDDSAVRSEPSHHVDYLSHEWKEEDIWSSWRHIVEHRSVYGERSRLENASWRTWAKTQFNLRTTSPESLNWLKDVDVTWLYGPLQPAANRLVSHRNSEPPSRLSKTNSFLNQPTRPILKKRSMSEVMLQNSISGASLVKQAAAAVQAQQVIGISWEGRMKRSLLIGRADCDFTSIPTRTTSRDTADYFSSRSTSGLQTPDHHEKKHIRFDEKVEQCIAVECKGVEDDEEEEEDFNHNPWAKYNEEDSSDDGMVMMKKSRRKKRPISRSQSTTNVAGESKTIAKLPSTTLKNRNDSMDTDEQHSTPHSLGFFRSSRLSPSPSQETLRPSNPSTNFLLAEDDDEDADNFTFDVSRQYDVKRSATPSPSDPFPKRSSASQPDSTDATELRRTESGMFMPFEDEDEHPPPPGIIGRVVDTVNTARDIAHVIWNVGWRN